MGDEMMLTIVDANEARHARVHGELADAAVAALAADPESLADLDAAIERYARRDGTRGFFEGWSPGVCNEPWDEGLCVIDLAARLAAWESTWGPPPEQEGAVSYHDPSSPDDIHLRYHLSEEWLITGMEGWSSLAGQRRAERLARPPLDFRAVLYGKVAGYLAQQCLAARADWTDASIAAIHAAWLMTPRDDLAGRTPRELLLERRRAIVWDLEDQALTWSKLGAAPPGLPLESAAYRYGGCGTHEVVLYYELLRHVLESARQWLYSEAGQPAADGIDAAELAGRLEEARRQWLDTPRLEGLTPLEVIELERRRIPLAVSGAEAMIDDDCPMCQMMADDLGPCFVHLDGCNMDDEFPFAFHLSRDEWEAERLEMEEFNRKFNAEWAARRAAEGDAASETWKESFSAADLAARSPDLALLGIAAHLSELGLKLKEQQASQSWVESLNRHFGNLREAVGNPEGGLLEPVVERFCDELAAAAADHPALGEQCADLDRQVRQLAEAIVLRTGGEDLPF